jgi:threonine/homoserine/homoserine lactone efflux protein
MQIVFLLKSFLIGLLAASGCGPIFVLTFNRSAICGFWKGFATALGASLGDGLYFMLGSLGALAVISELRYFLVFLDLIGGIVLIILGIHALNVARKIVCVTIECSHNIILSTIKAFTLTILNPLVILFFLAVSLRIFPEDLEKLPTNLVLLSSLSVSVGSLTMLSLVSLAASFVGSCITAKRLRIVSQITGVLFISFGLYLLGDLFSKLI